MFKTTPEATRGGQKYNFPMFLAGGEDVRVEYTMRGDDAHWWVLDYDYALLSDRDKEQIETAVFNHFAVYGTPLL